MKGISLAVLLACTASVQCFAQDVVMRRPLPAASTSTSGQQGQGQQGTGQDSGTQDGSGSSTDPSSGSGGDAMTGDAYAWYAACSGTTAVHECLSLSQDGDLGVPSDESICSVPQSAAYKAFVTQQSEALLGDPNALQPAGDLVLPDCSSSSSLGYGYSCSEDGAFECFSVDYRTYAISAVDPSLCAAPQKPGNFTYVLSYFSLKSPGVDPSTACRLSTFYGRKDQCELSTPDASGNMTPHLVQTCYGIDPYTNSVTQTDLQTCLSQPFGSINSKQGQTLSSLGLLVPYAGIDTECNNGGGYDFATKVTNDATTSNADGTSSRRIDYAYTCSKDGQPADMVNCQIDLVSFENLSQQYATDNGYTYFSNGEPGTDTWYIVYTYNP